MKINKYYYNKCHKQKWCVLLFTRIRLVAHVLAYAHAIVHIKCRRLALLFFKNEWAYKTILLTTFSFRVSKFQFVFEWLSTIAWNPAHMLGKKQGTWLYTAVWNRGQCNQLTNSKENYLPWYRGCRLIIWFPWLLFFYLPSFISFTLLPILDIYIWKSELLCL